MEGYIHLSSPLLYVGYVYVLQKLPSCPNNSLMKFCRTAHNINLSLLSAAMFILYFIGQVQVDKINTLDDLLCKPYEYNWYVNMAGYAFLYSKYIEWGDTLFLQLSGKPISMLQYTHHMSTAILTYVGFTMTEISPNAFVFLATNTFVHTPMYWYFAYPKGWLHKYRRMITQSQIVQHIICITTLIYTKSRGEDCIQSKYANELALALYSMYLFYFVSFYFSNKKTD